MKRTVERIRRVGAVVETTRVITDDSVMPLHWRVAIWFAVVELGGGLVLMAAIVAAAVAKRHGWL